MVGPDFRSPKPPKTKSYTKHPLAKSTASAPGPINPGKSQHFAKCENIPAEWWVLFHSPQMNALIKQGLANSPNLTAAKAALRQAQENLNVQVGNLLFPAVNLQGSANRQKFTGISVGSSSPSSIFDIYNIQANVSYLVDVFGGSRRQIEAYEAQVDYEQYQLIAAYLTLTSNIVTTAITAASLEAQIIATRELIRESEKQLAIIKKQQKLGGASLQNVLSQTTQVNLLRAQLPPLLTNLARSQHALAVLIGVLPSESQLPKIKLDALQLPAKIPIGIPSELVKQRPDVQAAEAQLHAASAQIGVTTANLLPQVMLNGNYGWISNIPSKLFRNASSVWSFGTNITQPLFHGGALFAARRAAIDNYQLVEAQYQQTVLQAFANVADSLRALENDAKEYQAQKEAELSAKAVYHLTQKQFHLGGASYLALLTAEQQYQQALINRIIAQAARYNDTAALFAALGGGWWNLPCGCFNGEEWCRKGITT